MKWLREFAASFVILALVARVWPEVWGIDIEREGPVAMTGVLPLFGAAVALTFAGHLLPARIGHERKADRQGQLGPRSPLLCGVGVLAGVSLMGGWGGPLGLGIALAAMAWSGRGVAGADADAPDQG